MDFQLSEDQVALQEGIRAFCDGRVSVEQLRELDEKGAFDRSLWSELAEMGVFGLRLSEEQGGVGLATAGGGRHSDPEGTVMESPDLGSGRARNHPDVEHRSRLRAA